MPAKHKVYLLVAGISIVTSILLANYPMAAYLTSIAFFVSTILVTFRFVSNSHEARANITEETSYFVRRQQSFNTGNIVRSATLLLGALTFALLQDLLPYVIVILWIVNTLVIVTERPPSKAELILLGLYDLLELKLEKKLVAEQVDKLLPINVEELEVKDIKLNLSEKEKQRFLNAYVKLDRELSDL